jgi:anti-anti-sigma factor
MTYTIQKLKENIQLLKVQGLFNEIENQQILQEVREGTKDGANSLIFDLSTLQFMNSVGLNLLIQLRTIAQSAGGYLSLVNPPDQVISLLEITKLKSFFRFNKTMDEAIETLRASEEV